MIEIIFEILTTLLFAWLFFKVIKLIFKVGWGVTKIIATLLSVIALPVLVICLIFAGGITLLIPLALIGGAFGLVKLFD